MGRKQTGKRKHFFFYLTCIINIFVISSLSGCAFKAKYMLTKTQDLMVRGDYKLAVERDQQLLKEYPELGDEALFQIGLIFAHPQNPDKNYKKSLTYFRRLIEEFPDSKLKNQAQIWASILYMVIERGKKIEEHQTEIVNLTEKINFLKKEHQSKDKKANELQQQIEKLKEIDLSIQKKKRSVNFK